MNFHTSRTCFMKWKYLDLAPYSFHSSLTPSSLFPVLFAHYLLQFEQQFWSSLILPGWVPWVPICNWFRISSSNISLFSMRPALTLTIFTFHMILRPSNWRFSHTKNASSFFQVNQLYWGCIFHTFLIHRHVTSFADLSVCVSWFLDSEDELPNLYHAKVSSINRTHFKPDYEMIWLRVWFPGLMQGNDVYLSGTSYTITR